MTDLRIGDVEVSTDPQAVILSHERKAIRVDADGILELIDFLSTCLSDEFSQRRTYRVPIFDDSKFSAQLVVGGVTLDTIPRNISMGGILLEYRESNPDGLSAGLAVHVVIQLGEEAVDIPAIVRHCTESRCGLQFRDETHPALAGIVMELQRQWIAKRVATGATQEAE